LTLGSSAAFAAGSVWRGSRAIQSNTPSVSSQRRRRSTFLIEEGFKKKLPFIIDRVEAKSLFVSFSVQGKKHRFSLMWRREYKGAPAGCPCGRASAGIYPVSGPAKLLPLRL